MAEAPRKRILYKDSLTPTLHRRFTKAALLAFVTCYIEAVAFGDKSSYLWSWFPLGLAGIRTLLLFISAFVIFIIRVAQIHVSSRNTTSPAASFVSIVTSSKIPYTFGIYIFSAWFFGEIYIWSAPIASDLGWTVNTKTHGLRRLNERPIFLRNTFFTLACVQAFLHLYFDYDQLHLPSINDRKDLATNLSSLAQKPPTVAIQNKSTAVLVQATRAALLTPVLGSGIYFVFLRHLLWRQHLRFAQVFISNQIRPSAAPHTIWPPYFLSLILRSIFSVFMLYVLWNASNVFFSAYVSLEPIKNGQPVTSASTDPNGSLLNGLKSKRELPCAFAMWELLFITLHFPARRTTIFEEIDRAGGSTWSQILQQTLSYINGISDRISLATLPPAPPPQGPPIEPLPRLTAPLKAPELFTPPRKPSSPLQILGSIAKEKGLSPRPHMTGPDLMTRISPYVDTSLVQGNSYMQSFLQSPLGFTLRQPRPRRMSSVILGDNGSIYVTTYAIEVLAALTRISMEDDVYGKVRDDIPSIVRAFTKAILSVDGFAKALPPNWAEVGTSSDGKCLIADFLGQRMRSALKEIIGAFDPYLRDLGLSMKEIREAKDLVGS